MAFRYILPAMALIGSTFAQCDGPSITISTSSDASQIASCQKYNGDVIIDPSATGTISLSGVQSIAGDLTIVNASALNAFSTDQLNEITGTFYMDGLIVLSSLQMSSLTRVNAIKWINLPALQTLNFAQGISQANTVYISNTQLTTLSGIELTAVRSMDINNNLYLNMVNVNNLKNVTEALSFSANNKDLAIEFPNLGTAGNLTFRNVSFVDLPSLTNVPGSAGFYGDTFLNFSAPNLTTVGQTLAVVDCPNLVTLSATSLSTIGGGFQLGNNSKLDQITGFDSLSKIGGAIDFAGTFSAVSFPKLSSVRGGANVQTSGTNTTICSLFNAAHPGVIQGNVQCQTNVAQPQNNGTTSNSSSSSGGGKKNAGVTSFDPSLMLTGVFGLAAALFFL